MNINFYNNYPEQLKVYVVQTINRLAQGIDDDIEVSLILVDLNEIQRLNLEYRGLDRPTDVISFEERDEEDEKYLGDIFVCMDKVFEQAKLYGHSEEREFAFLIVHGILHLQGYDHMNKDEEKIMFAKQEEILEKLGFRREQ